MPGKLRFDGKVVVVTGAGGGLGRSYALEFASRGASVVVNDLGGSADGQGKGTKMADEVVEEIRKSGGKAVANYNSVEDGDAIIKTAIDNYGRVAKLGLVGLSNTVALEGQKHNIFCNALVPTAGSRLTESVMPPDLVDALKPEYALPMVVYLSHESCDTTGGVLEAAAGWFGQLQWYRSQGSVLGRQATAEDVRDHWAEVTNMVTATHMTNQEVMGQLVGVLQNEEPSKAKRDPFSGAHQSNSNHTGGTNPELAKSHKFAKEKYTFTSKDAILYALGIGAETKTDLRYVFEGHEDFSVFPTFVVLPSFVGMADLNSAPGLHVDLTKLLHGEQYVEVFNPIPVEGTVVCEGRISEVMDKGSAAAVLFDVDIRDSTGNHIAHCQSNIILRGEGGFNGVRSSPFEKKTLPVPQRSPDAVVEQKTSLEQAALYRQSGDSNPLHIDPMFAQLAGFKSPILHGLCSFGVSVRHVVKQFGGNDPNNFRSVKARFSKPVYPGQTLVTEMWKDGNRIHFQTKVKETGDVAISGGYVELKAASALSNTGSGGGGGAASNLRSEAVFHELENRLKAQPDMAKKVQVIYTWIITKDGKEAKRWTADLKNGSGSIYEGDAKQGKAGVTLTLSDDTMADMVSGKINPQKAFMSGKLKIKGNIMLTQKLQTLLKDESKL